jgi:SAM-dependent methyltransferase
MSASSGRKEEAGTSKPTGNVDVFLDEYSRDDVIAKYLNGTAGTGIAYALTHVYGRVYLDVIRELIAERPRQHKFRVLEYGCGGGMNLLKLIELFRQQGAEIGTAIGADFSPPMIEAARREATRHLSRDWGRRLRFAVASNERLVEDLAGSLGCSAGDIQGTFDLVVGVNTFRYCHRLQKERDCARDIWELLAPGGYSVMIDMNRRFPVFRSKLTEMFSRRPKEESYLPSLEEYARPFSLAGFVIRERRNFCWVPHSAGPGLVALCRTVAPVLDRCCPAFAMRSLVVAQRPA